MLVKRKRSIKEGETKNIINTYNLIEPPDVFIPFLLSFSPKFCFDHPFLNFFLKGQCCDYLSMHLSQLLCI